MLVFATAVLMGLVFAQLLGPVFGRSLAHWSITGVVVLLLFFPPRFWFGKRDDR
jgi:hypothetical protein